MTEHEWAIERLRRDGLIVASDRERIIAALAAARAQGTAEAFERAAKAADDALAKWDANCNRPQREHSGPSYAAAVGGASAAKDIAAAIRALAREAAK